MTFFRFFEDVLAFGGSDEEQLSTDGIKEQMTKCHDALQGLYEALTVAKTYSKWEQTDEHK